MRASWPLTAARTALARIAGGATLLAAPRLAAEPGVPPPFSNGALGSPPAG